MIKKLLVLTSIMFSMSACSVFMAATSSDEFDLSKVQVGSDRAKIEEVLGAPITYFRQSQGDVATYQIITGDRGDYRRAATYAVLDGLTLGLAEIVSFPTEALQGDQQIFTITYDNRGRAKKVEAIFKKAPAPNPSDLVEEQLADEKPQGA